MINRRIPVVGPRHLPSAGTVRVWIDAGSGPGYDIEVRPEDLTPDPHDDGLTDRAVYSLTIRECRG
jgi:hypothetical protein